jgi:hypothetical protein
LYQYKLNDIISCNVWKRERKKHTALDHKQKLLEDLCERSAAGDELAWEAVRIIFARQRTAQRLKSAILFNDKLDKATAKIEKITSSLTNTSTDRLELK